jgi:hypothetical protein
MSNLSDIDKIVLQSSVSPTWLHTLSKQTLIDSILEIKNNGPEKKKELDKRILEARSQGMKWNRDDKKPNLTATVVRKLNEWEKGFKEGMESDPKDFKNSFYEDVLKSKGRAFISGLCSKIEKSKNSGQESSYLPVRFRRNLGIQANSAPKPVVNTSPSKTPTAEDVVRAWLGNSLDPDSFEKRVKVVKKKMEAGEDGVSTLIAITSAKYPPIGIEYDRDGTNPTGAQKYQSIKVKRLYDDKIKKFWDDLMA